MPLYSLQINQTAALVLGYALTDQFPQVKLFDCEVNERGFAFTFALKQLLQEEGLAHLERKVKEYSKQDLDIQLLEMARLNAVELLNYHQCFELADALKKQKDQLVLIAKIEDEYQLCKVPPLEETSVCKLKLISIEHISTEENGYFVQRIEGIAFAYDKELKQYLKQLDAAKKVDHRLLGPQMQLFSYCEQPMLQGWFWQSKGTILKALLVQAFEKKLKKSLFNLIQTPRLMNADIYLKICKTELPTFIEGEDEEEAGYLNNSAISHALIFQSQKILASQLPIRYAEWNQQLSPQIKGKRQGLFQTSVSQKGSFSIFCSAEQVLQELISSLQFIEEIVKILNFSSHWYLRSRSQRVAEIRTSWHQFEKMLEKALQTCALSAIKEKDSSVIDGPILELRFKDNLGQEWVGASLGVNFTLTKTFNLRYQGKDEQECVPFLLTGSFCPSLERVIALMIEQAGDVPFWAAPEQIRVLSVGKTALAYAKQVATVLEQEGFRVRLETSDEALHAKIMAAETQRVPYMLVLGEKESKNQTLAVRARSKNEKQLQTDLASFLVDLKKQQIASAEDE